MQRMQHDDGGLGGVEATDVAALCVGAVPDGGIVVLGYEVDEGHGDGGGSGGMPEGRRTRRVSVEAGGAWQRRIVRMRY